MQEFRKKVSMRVSIFSFFICLYFFCYGLIIKYIPKSDNVLGFIVGFMLGVQILIVYFTLKYRKALKNDTNLKKLYNYENYERRIYIKNKSSQSALYFLILTFPTFIIILGAYSDLLFKTLFFIYLYVLTIFLIFKIYYLKKY